MHLIRSLWSAVCPLRLQRCVVPILALLAGTQLGCSARATGAALYPRLAEHSGKKINAVRFSGTGPFSADSLRVLIDTQPSRCNFLGLPFCVPFTSLGREEHFLDLAVISGDVRTLELVYRQEGYFGTQVEPGVEPEADDEVEVTFAIRMADPIILDSLTVTGTDTIFDPDSLALELPIQVGDTFDLGLFAASADTVLRRLLRRGHAYAQVLRNYGVDTLQNRAVASLDAVAGPQVTIDSIIVTGADHLGRKEAIRQLEFSEGDLLVPGELTASQRNLYSLELIQFASVTIAPDSMRPPGADSSRATVLVALAEAPVHQIDAAVGYGTVECARVEGRWVNRSFMGGARRLSVNGAVSKIGISGPLDAGLERSLCRAFQGDTLFERGLDYRFATNFTQPYFISPRNQLAVDAFWERISEPLVFQRIAKGGQIGLTRRLATRSQLTSAIEIERGKTIASPALFCAAFQVCEPTIADSLSKSRYRNALSLTYITDETDVPYNPVEGYILRGALTYAPSWMRSDIRFVRLTGEGSIYREFKPGYVWAAGLRFGNFFQSASLDPIDGRNFLPPEERFFTGGSSSVRGFRQNELGPGIYVQTLKYDDGEPTGERTEPRFVPVGGTSITVANAELRFPSPFLPRLLRLAAFVDAGTINTGNFWDLQKSDLRVTPGAGLRLATPVGPVRIDLAYNPHRRVAGPLYVLDPQSGRLVQEQAMYEPDALTFFERLQIHVGIGQAF